MMSSSNDTDRDAEKEQNKSNRPRERSFYQQRLSAWQPLLTARSVFPLFLVIGIVFVPLGVWMYIVSGGVFERVIDYTHCKSGTIECSSVIAQTMTRAQYRVCNCNVTFNLEADVTGQVFMYYRLTNFFQNHRRYVKSRDDQQLHGNAVTSPSADCAPYRFLNNNQSLPFAPCGAIANSLFNDTFTLHFQNGSSLVDVGLIKSGIAWSTDVNRKFGNPPLSYFNTAAKPINWKQKANERVAKPFTEDEDLIVWMRTAALPKFRKLYRRINHTATFANGLPKGNYVVKIAYAYPVTSFVGTKSIILSTTSWLGGKNNVLGISYMTIGAIHLVLAIAFLIMDVKTRKRNRYELGENFKRRTDKQKIQHFVETSSLNVERDQRV